MERKVIGVITSRHGNPVNIYAVANENVKISILKQHALMRVTYRLGERGTDTFEAKYIEATDEYRSLIFEHPTKGDGRKIWIPTNNIIELERVNK